MNDSCRFSNVTKVYLREFYCILDKMIQEMTDAELGDSISNNFIIQMIPHHRAAIKMSQNLLQYTTCVPLQEIASNIIESQNKSIENMLCIQGNCLKCRNTNRDLCLYQRRVKQILQTMFTGMENSCTTNRIDCNFMYEMIPHHRGAVRMSENALDYCICPELIPILDDIITSQKQGIAKMQHLLRCSRC